MKYTMNLNNEPFKAIKEGYKTIEMRLNDDRRKPIKLGDTIEFCNIVSDEKLECLVLNKYEYDSFIELYKHHDKVSIGYKNNEIADPNDMLEYYKIEDINKYGVVGIEIKKV